MWWDAMRSPAARWNHPKAVEKTVPWKPWKTKPRFPTAPTAPWKTRNLGEFPTTGMVRRSSIGWSDGISYLVGVIVIHTIGIDLSKTTFHVVGLDEQGAVVVRKKLSRKQLLVYTAKLARATIGMEACGGSHYLGRALEEQGHEVCLM